MAEAVTEEVFGKMVEEYQKKSTSGASGADTLAHMKSEFPQLIAGGDGADDQAITDILSHLVTTYNSKKAAGSKDADVFAAVKHEYEVIFGLNAPA
jgi:hypothetical protein